MSIPCLLLVSEACPNQAPPPPELPGFHGTMSPPTSTTAQTDHFRSSGDGRDPPPPWISHVPRRPSAHADSNTPAGEADLGSVAPRPPTAFPFWLEVGSNENYRGLLRVHVTFGLRICTSVAPRTSPEASVGDLSPQLLQWLPGEPTIPRTGLSPAGLRDPGGLSAI